MMHNHAALRPFSIFLLIVCFLTKVKTLAMLSHGRTRVVRWQPRVNAEVRVLIAGL